MLINVTYLIAIISHVIWTIRIKVILEGEASNVNSTIHLVRRRLKEYIIRRDQKLIYGESTSTILHYENPWVRAMDDNILVVMNTFVLKNHNRRCVQCKVVFIKV